MTARVSPALTGPGWAGRRHVRVIPVLEVVVALAFALLPLALGDYLVQFAGRVLILAMLALSFDLVWGYAGIMSFGQALFFGVAGYTVAVLARDDQVSSILVAAPVSILAGSVVALGVAIFLFAGRRVPSTIFVALGTLTGAFVAEELARAWYYLGGQNGIPSIPVPTAAGYTFSDLAFYYLIFAAFVSVYLFCRWFVRSQFGLTLAGIREQEERLGFFGYRVQWFKLLIFTLAGAVAGLAGGLYAFHEGFVWPNMLGVVLSTQIVLYCLFGGIGTLAGAVLGVIGIEILSYVLSDSYPGIWPIILGLLLLLVILFCPTGIIGLLVRERERVTRFGRPARRGN